MCGTNVITLNHLFCNTITVKRIVVVSSYLTFPEESNGNQSIYMYYVCYVYYILYVSKYLL